MMEDNGNKDQGVFQVHLVSDATGETLVAIARAAAAQYASMRANEHVHSFIRSRKQLDEALVKVREFPGIVLYTLVDPAARAYIDSCCAEMGLPSVCVLDPVLEIFRSYLGMEATPRIGGQHALDAEYFDRIEALNFTMIHDDGQRTDDLETADIILVGASRTSKTPTSIYLANRGFKVANIPIISGSSLPQSLTEIREPFVVGLIASTGHIMHTRRNRLLSLQVGADTDYVDRRSIAAEIRITQELCNANHWSILDVTRRSIEETAAAIIALYKEHERPSGKNKKQKGLVEW